MAFDYKKEYKEFYLPPKKPSLVTIPPMNFVAVQGKGDPNEPDGEYQAAMELLYGIAFTIKMSYKGSHKIDGYFEYVVPPLEGLWHQAGVDGVDYAHKETFEWTSMIRLPEFVTKAEFDWAVQEATAKKRKDSRRRNSSIMTRGFVFSVCTLVHTTVSRKHCARWTPLRRCRDMRLTLQPDATMRSISPTLAARLRKSARQSYGTQFEKNKSGQIHKRCRFWL